MKNNLIRNEVIKRLEKRNFIDPKIKINILQTLIPSCDDDFVKDIVIYIEAEEETSEIRFQIATAKLKIIPLNLQENKFNSERIFKMMEENDNELWMVVDAIKDNDMYELLDFDTENSGICYIQRLFIPRELRNLGLGESFLNIIYNSLDNISGIHITKSFVIPAPFEYENKSRKEWDSMQVRLRKFYERNGFIRISDDDVYYRK